MLNPLPNNARNPALIGKTGQKNGGKKIRQTRLYCIEKGQEDNYYYLLIALPSGNSKKIAVDKEDYDRTRVD